MRLIMMRHGQTAWNVEHRIQGHTDIPLDERGREQAAAIAERLSCMELAAVYASPLLRAFETGSVIAQRNHCPIYKEDRLIERFFGDWEGLCMTDIAHNKPEAWQQWVEDPENCPIPNAEPLQAVLQRSLACTEEITKKHPEGNVVIVSHANPVKLLLMHYAGIPLEKIHKIRTDNCSYSELGLREGSFVLNALNETGFLRERGLL